MSKGAYKKDGDARISLIFPNTVEFIHTYSFLSAWIDEAHGARTCNMLWHAIEALFHVTLVKVLLTATPLLQAAAVSSHSYALCLLKSYIGLVLSRSFAEAG